MLVYFATELTGVLTATTGEEKEQSAFPSLSTAHEFSSELVTP